MTAQARRHNVMSTLARFGCIAMSWRVEGRFPSLGVQIAWHQ